MVDDELANYEWTCHREENRDIVCDGGEDRQIRIEEGRQSIVHIEHGDTEVEASPMGRLVVEGGRTVDELISEKGKLQRHLNTNPIHKR